MWFPNVGKASVEIIGKHIPKLGWIQLLPSLLPHWSGSCSCCCHPSSQEDPWKAARQTSQRGMKTLQTRGSGYIALFYKSLHRKRDWRTSSLSFCLQALCCSRSDASGGVHSRDFPGLLGFSSLLMTGLFCELSHLSLVVCQGGCNNISQRQRCVGAKFLFGNCSATLPGLSLI